MFALSSSAVTGIYSVIAALIAAGAVIATTMFARDSKAQSRKVTSKVGEFERAYRMMQAERENDRKRIGVLETREDQCFEALEELIARMAVLEARGVDTDE